MRLDFSHSFDADIWEVLFHNNRLLITTRDSEKLAVSFSLFDLAEQKFLWKNISFEESWWVSVYHFADNVIVFQTYDDTQNIEARSIFGFNSSSLEADWAVDNVKLFNVQSNVLSLASMDSPETTFGINIQTGQEVSEEVVFSDEDQDSSALYPTHYETDNPHFETISKFLKEKVQVHLEGSCDYLEWGDYFAVSANTKVEAGYNLDLFVFNLEGELVLQQSLESGLKGLATGTFFIVNQALIFVEGKRNLIVYGF